MTPRSPRGEEQHERQDQLDVLIAVYLIPDLAQQDFDAFVKLAEDGADLDRRRRARHQGRERRGRGPRDGRSPRPQGSEGRRRRRARARALRAAAPGGDGRRRRARRPRGQVRAQAACESGIGEKMDDALPPGSAGIIAIYDHDDADVVAGALANAIRVVDRADRQGLREGAEGRARGGIGRARGLRRARENHDRADRGAPGRCRRPGGRGRGELGRLRDRGESGRRACAGAARARSACCTSSTTASPATPQAGCGTTRSSGSPIRAPGSASPS